MFVAQNRFRIATAQADAFEKHWRDRESRLASQAGFVRFRLLRARLPETVAGAECVEFVSYTEWLDRPSFLNWLEGGAARKAHEKSAFPREAYLGPPEFRGYDVVLDEVAGGRSDHRSVHQDQVVERLFARETPAQARILEASRAEGLPPINIGPFEGHLIEILLRSISARRGVEIGTLGGYSASWIARALPADGRLLSLEKDPARARQAREHLAAAGLGEKVEIRSGDALEILPALDTSGPWGQLDFVFIDADKGNYGNYVRWALPRLRPGGLCLIDNAYLWGAMNYVETQLPEAADASRNQFAGMAEAWRSLAAHPEFASIILPTGEGLGVALKLP